MAGDILQTDGYTPARGVTARMGRRLTQYRAAAPLSRQPRRPIISFSFDDFPKSAAETGAAILARHDVRACFYACTGMAGQSDSPCGPLYDAGDIARLAAAGHEIGAHSASHIDCAQAATAEALGDITRGVEQLVDMGAPAPVTQFAWPYGETRAELKHALKRRFSGARGVLAGINGKGTDRMQLRAVELDMARGSFARAHRAIEKAMETSGWLIFFTHDVRDAPGPWGVTPALLDEVVRAAIASGAALLPPGAALAEIEGAPA